MKMRNKTVIIASIAFVLILAGVLVYYNLANAKREPTTQTAINLNQVSSIEFFDCNKGKNYSITKQADIQHIVTNLNSVKFVKEGPWKGNMGISFSIVMKDRNRKKVWNGVFYSAGSLNYNDYSYYDKSGGIDLPYIEKTIANLTPIPGGEPYLKDSESE